MVPVDTQRFDRLTRVADITLGVSGCFCILLLLYDFYYYTWTGKRSFTSPVSMVWYYGLPSVLATMLFTSLRLRPLPRISFALVLVSVAASTFATNLFLALVGFPLIGSNKTLWFRERDLAEIVHVARKHNVTFDTRTILEAVRDLHRRGIDAVPSIIPWELLRLQPDGTRTSVLTIDGTEVLPHGGMSDKITIFCNESGTHEWYDSDEHGFHNPKGVWSATQIEVVALGDSFTQGHCVASDTNFVALIRRQYPSTVNLGINGQGPLMMLATLRDYGPALKPKVVVWFFFEGNDLHDLSQEQNSPLLMRYLQSDFRQPLLQWQAEIDQALDAFLTTHLASSMLVKKQQEAFSQKIRHALFLLGKLVKLSHVRQRLGWISGDHHRDGSSQAGSPTAQALIGVFDQALRQGKQSVASWGGTLYFVYLPDRERYANPQNAMRAREHVLRTVRNVGIPLIDIDHTFRAQPDPLAFFPFQRLGHYNEAGHRLVAEAVLRSISVSD